MGRFLSMLHSLRGLFVDHPTPKSQLLSTEKLDHALNDDTATIFSDHSNFGRKADVESLLSTPGPLTLKINRLDQYWCSTSSTWKYRATDGDVTKIIAAGSASGPSDEDWSQYCFVVTRRVYDGSADDYCNFWATIKSPYLRAACKHVMGDIFRVSWNEETLNLTVGGLIAFLPSFEAYQAELSNMGSSASEDERNMLSTVTTLVEFLHQDYRRTIANIRDLTSRGEITYDLLYAVLIPHSIMISDCSMTQQPCAFRLISREEYTSATNNYYDLRCESIDAADPTDHHGNSFGRVRVHMSIPYFSGVVKINRLPVYPLKYHHSQSEVEEKLLARGRKWVALKGVHHQSYEGAAFTSWSKGASCVTQYNINSRIMIDRAKFKWMKPNYRMMSLDQEDPSLATPRKESLTDEELLLTPPVVFGFSLSDQLWLEFNVELIQPIEWKDDLLPSLVLPDSRKNLLRSLVESHKASLGVTDAIRGKANGLVVNLSGPSGVGKTLTAEAICENARLPLLLLGASEMSLSDDDWDWHLKSMFDVARSWGAVVLIEEADVFLQRRNLKDIEHNAMVAIFLRHIENYRGILFMTTNRFETFDKAFLSRIHFTIQFYELSFDDKEKIWRAYLSEVGLEIGDGHNQLSTHNLQSLASRSTNGREIKNATWAAASLSASRNVGLSFAVLEEVLDYMHEPALGSMVVPWAAPNDGSSMRSFGCFS